jgi:replicative superfamily II helicase
VIFKHAWVGFKHPTNMLDNTKYRQMAGRAGRAGIDTEGEAILVVSKDNYPAAQLLDLMRVSCTADTADTAATSAAMLCTAGTAGIACAVAGHGGALGCSAVVETCMPGLGPSAALRQ